MILLPNYIYENEEGIEIIKNETTGINPSQILYFQTYPTSHKEYYIDITMVDEKVWTIKFTQEGKYVEFVSRLLDHKS